MIKQVHITNFKSLADVTVNLDPVTVLIGRSGTGKSNFVEALRWLRDFLRVRNEGLVHRQHGGWQRIMCATAPSPVTIAFAVTFSAPGFTEDFEYLLRFEKPHQQTHPHLFAEEKLSLGKRVLFHQRNGQWVEPPPLVHPPQPGTLALGGLTGLQEATFAYLVLSSGIGCYAFPDTVLTQPLQSPRPEDVGLADDGANYLQALIEITTNLRTWHALREMAASLRCLKASLKSIDLEQPLRRQVFVTLEAGGRLLPLDISQESEGFRRLLACLIALHQSPPKQTVIFDEPEKGIYPGVLELLADEFKGYASKGSGQVILTTHSPEFLNHFGPEQIRVVEMHDYNTAIGPVAPEQMDALRQQLLFSGELLTVDPARLPGSLTPAE